VLIVVVVFVVVLSAIYGVYWAVVARPEEQEQRSVLKRLKTGKRSTATASLVKARERLSAVPLVERMLSGQAELLVPLRQLIDRAGVQWSVGVLVMATVFIGLTTTVVVSSVSHYWSVGAVVGMVAAAGPYLWLRRKASKRRATFEEQFPQAIDLIARALRAGHALPTALQMVGDESADPVGREFRILFEQQNFGLGLPDALRAFAARIDLIDARFFATTVLTQRESGGNLSEILDRLAAVIRERFKVKRQVRSVSAHGRITGLVLGFLPPAVALVLFVISPEHIRLLVDDPIGLDMAVTAIVLQIIGVLIIRRIVDVEY
jgi:tight adherence protein B